MLSYIHSKIFTQNVYSPFADYSGPTMQLVIDLGEITNK